MICYFDLVKNIDSEGVKRFKCFKKRKLIERAVLFLTDQLFWNIILYVRKQSMNWENLFQVNCLDYLGFEI